MCKKIGAIQKPPFIFWDKRRLCQYTFLFTGQGTLQPNTAKIKVSRLAVPVIYDENQKFEFGKGIQIGEGTDASIIATGVGVSEAIKAQEILKEKGINVRVVDIHTIKPIDEELIIKCAKETKRIITLEDHNVIGGLGSAVCEVLSENYPTKVERIGIQDEFGRSGKAEELMKLYKIDAEAIVNLF